MSRSETLGYALSIALLLSLTPARDATACTVCVDYGSYLGWEGFVPTVATNSPWMAVVGNTACILDFVTEEVHVYDVTDPSTAIHTATLGFTGKLCDIQSNGSLITLLGRVDGEARLHVIDVSDPFAPVVLGQVDYNEGALRHDVEGTSVYIAGSCTITRIDISTPSEPQLANHHDFFGDYTTQSLTAVDGLVYAVTKNDAPPPAILRLHIIDFSGSSTRWLSETTLGEVPDFESADVCVIDGRALVPTIAANGEVMYFLDVDDPSNPFVISTISTISGVLQGIERVKTHDGLVYAGKLNGLAVLEVNQNGVVPVAELRGPFSNQLAISGDRLFVASRGNIHVVNIASPTAAPVCAHVEGGGFDVAVDGDLALVANGGQLRIVDVANPRAPSEVATPTADGSAAVAVSGNTAFIACDTDPDGQLILMDISTPSSPAVLSNVTTGRCTDIVLDSDQAYISTRDGLERWKVSDVGSPILEGSLSGIDANQLEFAGDAGFAGKLILLATNNGMKLVDATDPSNMAVIATYEPTVSMRSVTAEGAYAYMASPGRFWIVDISNPAAPTTVAALGLPAIIPDVEVHAGIAYLAVHDRGFWAVDVQDPTAPFSIGGSSGFPESPTQPLGFGRAVAVSGDHLYGLGTSVLSIGRTQCTDCDANVRYYVDASAAPGGDGSSWSTAFDRIPDTFGGCGPEYATEVWVAAGTYTPDAPGGDRTKSFHLADNLEMYGGFAGFETDITQRDIQANVTILSGDLNGDDAPGNTNTADNSAVVVNGSDSNSTAILDGFTIRGANAISPFAPAGGVFNDQGSPTIRNCVFKENDDGAMRNINESAPRVSDCVFSDNLGTQLHPAGSSGAAMANSTSSPVVERCVFERNQILGSNTQGGAVSNTAGAPVFIDCEFTDNLAGNVETTGLGGALYASGSTMTVTRCTFANNEGRLGGAVYDRVGLSTFVDCRFFGNRAVRGGAVELANAATPSFIQCEFTGNEATSGDGGAIHSTTDAGFTLINTTLVGNVSAANGGGVAHANSTGSATIINSILWDNTGASGSYEDNQLYAVGSTVSIAYSCVRGWTGSHGGLGNIGTDPLLRDPDGPDDILGTEDDDVAIRAASSCIDAGDSAVLPVSIVTDIAGQPRFVDDPCTVDTGPGAALVVRVDMGAHELQGASCATPVVHTETRVAFAVGAVTPNPTRGPSQLDFSLPTTQKVRVDVFDTRGRRVRTLLHRELPADRHQVRWDGLDANGHMAARGVYFVRLSAQSGTRVRRVTQIR